MMGFDCESFSKILQEFAPMFSRQMPFDKLGMIIESSTPVGKKEKFSLRIASGLC
jgi:hypothetical protein